MCLHKKNTTSFSRHPLSRKELEAELGVISCKWEKYIDTYVCIFVYLLQIYLYTYTYTQKTTTLGLDQQQLTCC